MKRITVPAEAVRTREQILDGQVIRRTTAGEECVWVTCGNCGGTGNYPSSMLPPGRCRFYCWDGRTPDTYGKLPVAVEKFVKQAQAADRRAYRAKVQWELDAPKREEAARAEAARQEAIRAEEERMARADLERKAISQWQGTVGERLEVEGRIVMVRSYQKPHFVYRNMSVTAYVTKLRDAQGNLFVWFSETEWAEGATVKIRGTVKKHDEYQGERQTTLNRVKEG